MGVLKQTAVFARASSPTTSQWYSL